MGLTNNLGKLSSIITSTGSAVGIGTSSPYQQVSIIPATNLTDTTSGQLSIGESSNNNGYKLNLGYYISGGTYKSFIQSNAGGSGTNLLLNPNGGSVLIGTSTAPSAIGVNDLLVLGKSGSASNAINFSNGSTTNWAYILAESAKMVLGTGSSSSIAFETNGGSERMRIQSNGNVLMGKTAEDNAADGFQYRGAVPGLVQITRAGGEALQLWRYTSNGKMLVFYYAGSEVGSISSNSNSLPSDLNFKKDISNITLGLNLVTKLRPVHYRHKLDDDNEALSNGIIAQELEQALLECGIENNSLLMLQHKPNEKENESQYWVDYTKMIPILIKSIQEQNQTIQELNERLNKAGL